MGRRNHAIAASKIRRKLARMPEEINKDVKRAITVEANILGDTLRANAPYDADSLLKAYDDKPRKHLRDAIQVRVYDKGLLARVGIVTKKTKLVYWYARLLEYGFHPWGNAKFVRREFFWKSWRPQKNQARAHLLKAGKEAFQRVARSKV